MNSKAEWIADPEDIRVLRDLYIQKRELSEMPVMAERRKMWKDHASLNSFRPMILAETQGVVDELVPLSVLKCKQEWARNLERELRELIFRCKQVDDDYVVEPRIEYLWQVGVGNFGVETTLVRGDNQGKLGSYHWDPPIRDLDRDFDRLHFRSLEVDRPRTLAWKAFLEEHFGDILPVEPRGMYWWTSGLTWSAINLVGLQPFMLAMYDNPRGVHRLMAFLRDDFMHYLDWFESEDLLHLNNENDYTGSGSLGYTTELPRNTGGVEQIKTPGENHPVRVCDLWGLSESQETVGVSPGMFEEFILPYQEPIANRYGLIYYGCCEPLHTRIKSVKKLPNLRRVSVSPWCDQEKMADELGKDYIFCRKPNPTLISTDRFDERLILGDLRHTLQVTKGCSLELVMKDVHTLKDQPQRLGRWVSLARQACSEFGF